MTRPLPGAGALPVRRSYLVDTPRLTGLVVEVDPTQDPGALAVLQAGLHETPEGARLGFGYDVTSTGLGAWVGDRGVRVTIWPALVEADGTVVDDQSRHEGPRAGHADSEVLVIDLDLVADRSAIDHLVRVGRLIVAAPDAGPVPLVVDLDPALVAAALTAAERN